MNNWWILNISVGIFIVVSTTILGIITKNKMKADNKGSYSYYSFDEYKTGFVCIATWIIFFGLIFILTLIYNIFAPLKAKNSTYRYQIKYEYVMEVIDNRDSLENIQITQTILEYNSWLEKALASKKTYGNWSWYRDIDIESMKFLGVDYYE